MDPVTIPTTLHIQIDQTIQLFIFLIFCGVFLTLANDLLNLLAWIGRKLKHRRVEQQAERAGTSCAGSP